MSVFLLSGSGRVKAARKMLMKLTPGDDFYRMDRISTDSEDKVDKDPRDTRGHTSDGRNREACHKIQYIASLELHNRTLSCFFYTGKAANSSCYTEDSYLE